MPAKTTNRIVDDSCVNVERPIVAGQRLTTTGSDRSGLFNACLHAWSFAHELHGRGQASNKPERMASDQATARIMSMNARKLVGI
ncbi:MAG: hypothetical protein EPN73_24425 [Paraburkholderia sp.]|nr:MAG: hypothetical protein EPN73_24425 [Paraburkholderia sp.]